MAPGPYTRNYLKFLYLAGFTLLNPRQDTTPDKTLSGLYLTTCCKKLKVSGVSVHRFKALDIICYLRFVICDLFFPSYPADPIFSC